MIRYLTIKNLLLYASLLVVTYAFGKAIFPVHLIVR